MRLPMHIVTGRYTLIDDFLGLFKPDKSVVAYIMSDSFYLVLTVRNISKNGVISCLWPAS